MCLLGDVSVSIKSTSLIFYLWDQFYVEFHPFLQKEDYTSPDPDPQSPSCVHYCSVVFSSVCIIIIIKCNQSSYLSSIEYYLIINTSTTIL